MKKLLKLFGVGILTGAGTRAGIMLMESLFPNGFGALLAGFKTGNNTQTETENKTTAVRRI